MDSMSLIAIRNKANVMWLQCGNETLVLPLRDPGMLAVFAGHADPRWALDLG